MKRESLVWAEVWIEGALDIHFNYILLVRKTSFENIEILDPQKEYAILERFNMYEDAVHWLSEDEYERIETRWPDQEE